LVDVDTDVDADNDLNTDNDNLPDTASGMPLLGLIGLLALGDSLSNHKGDSLSSLPAL
jgi:hypothetical protein